MILIVFTPRTGSSMVTKIFHNHGCILGSQSFNSSSCGYPIYEHDLIKSLTKELWRDHVKGKEFPYGNPIEQKPEYLERTREIVDLYAPELSKWVYKAGAELAPLFLQFKPKIVLIHRDKHQTIQSTLDKAPDDRTYESVAKIHDRRIKYMTTLEKEYDGVWVDSDEIIAGNYDSLKKAIECCGLNYVQSSVDEAIIHDLWKNR